jgi:hypothetical protein
MKIVWTREITNTLLKLVDENPNHSYEQIAKIMSARFSLKFTKNSLIGKSRRLRMPERPPKVIVVTKEGKTIPIPPVIVRPAPGARLTIYELREGDCKWPMCKVEDQPPYIYCGKPALLGRSWCKEHFKEVHDRTTYGNAKIAHPKW